MELLLDQEFSTASPPPGPVETVGLFSSQKAFQNQRNPPHLLPRWVLLFQGSPNSPLCDASNENTGQSLISSAGAMKDVQVFDAVSRLYCTAFWAPGVSGTFEGTAFWVRDLGGGTKCVSFAGDRAAAAAFGLVLVPVVVPVLVLVLQAARAMRDKTAKGNAMRIRYSFVCMKEPPKRHLRQSRPLDHPIMPIAHQIKLGPHP